MTLPALPERLPERIQDLAPKWAHFCLDVEKFARDGLGVDLGGKTLLAAVSGGLDSVCLLVVAKLLARKNRGRVFAGHLDHGLRPESAADARFVQELCAHLDVPCRAGHADVAGQAAASGLGIEEAGRIARAKFLESLRSELNADLILLGHHLGDLAEDVLLRLCRGTGWPGLAGMAGYDPDRRILRPFLHTPKAELAAFAQAVGLPFCEDASNQDRSFARNRLRAEVLPRLKDQAPGLLESVARLSRLAALDRAHFDAALSEAGFGAADFPPHREGRPALIPKSERPDSPTAADSQPPGGIDFQAQPPALPPDRVRVHLPRERLALLHPALRLRLYHRVLDALGPGQVLADSLLLLDQAFAEKRTGCLIQFPGGKAAKITAAGIDFSRENQ
jgi:tRNA(Ile)-lysidine synthase